MPAPRPDRPLPQLPPGFRFGTSTASYQIEGAASEGGKGPSIWDTFSDVEGHIQDRSTGAVACDHYHRYAEDVALMKQLGVGGYRFSISWPRIQPTGKGRPNADGLGFYDRLIDELLANDVQPMATLYHWDLPQALEDDGGWLNRTTVDRFAEYAAILGDRFADRVEHWIPINEPNVVMMMGYSIGMHAPGRQLMFDAVPVAHHLLLAHGRAAIELRRAGATSIGCANNHAPMWPASDDEADVGATKLFDALWNGMFTEPMLLGRYPADLQPLLDGIAEAGDMAVIRQPLDFYGVNYYNPLKIGAAREDAEMPFEFRELVGYDTTDFGWPVVPDALREWLITLRARYRAALPPIYITESGCAYNVGPDEHGVVDDQQRIDYLDSHLRAIATAVQRGVDVRGYYTWSLMDNFEWAEGFTQRFGLVHVDYETLERTPKRSFQWYADLIAAQTKSIG
ncbi:MULTISPECIES: GH1 family beta-glucosidase [unclassified Nocardioides]|uniref:GH1 family beta-glucosidase n=1 Tax=unclassified Nocardioides TaxID=2615069 RepID=UPI0009F03D10|nr:MULTISPECIES: GH1 family beta-glucosidase [unclassified Nocardioides]GAW50227.1 beta-glucosidase [Nocardioides sp. PD653-B2]GAW53124.1 beta-glucosidase [Nocardioides sp. PD653]